MTLKIGTSAENSLVFKPQFHLLKDSETWSDLTPTMANISAQIELSNFTGGLYSQKFVQTPRGSFSKENSKCYLRVLNLWI